MLMNFEIKALTPEYAEEFTTYLSTLDFGHAPHWASCFCRFYHTTCSQEEWRNRSGEVNQGEALAEIKAGRMKGYLAFTQGKCVGWLNANNASSYVRLTAEMAPVIQDKQVGCAICFVIHPDYRGQGVARELLKQAVEDFRTQGFQAVLALPIDSPDNPQMQYRGTVNMYSQLGFKEIQRHGNLRVMWLEL